jgi:hypothetical protein
MLATQFMHVAFKLLCVAKQSEGCSGTNKLPYRCCVLMQDGGDPDVAVSPRDIVYTLDASEAAAAAAKGVELAPEVLATTDLRCGGVSWCDGE